MRAAVTLIVAGCSGTPDAGVPTTTIVHSGGATSMTSDSSGATAPEAGGATELLAGGGTFGTGGANGAPVSGGTGAMGGTTAVGAASGASPATGGASHPSIELPPANAGFDYQLGGEYAPPSGVRVVVRDRTSAPAAGLYNVCYVNGFQIQPDEEDFWLTQHSDLILKDAAGDPVVDRDWDEMLLDTRTDAKRAAIAAIIGEWIAKCASDGFDAVEFDNLDSYSRSQLLARADNVALVALLARTAHVHGLAAAQKNSTELLGDAVAMGTDFAIAEECNRYDECDAYQAVYGNRVFVIEYDEQYFQIGCKSQAELSIVLRDGNLVPVGETTYVYQSC